MINDFGESAKTTPIPISSPDANDQSIKLLIQFSELEPKLSRKPKEKINNVTVADLLPSDKELFGQLSYKEIERVILLANYLDNRSLLDTLLQTVADRIKGRTPEEIRQILGIKNDFTKEAETKLRQDNQWVNE